VGPGPGEGVVSLITQRARGWELSEGDLDLLPHALDSLRAVHKCGVLHGDIRLPNFIVVEPQSAADSQLKPVVVIDFGRASIGGTAAEYAQEEEELRELLQPAGCVSALRACVHASKSCCTTPISP
jgi:serine/threonine protein kinase